MYVLNSQIQIERAGEISAMIQKCNAKIGNYQTTLQRYELADWSSPIRLMYTREYLEGRIIANEKVMLRLTKAYINTIVKLVGEVNRQNIMPEKFILI